MTQFLLLYGPPIYFIIGILYVLLNGYVRKLNTEGDYLLPLVWFGLWPICWFALLVGWLVNVKNKV